MAGCDFKIRDAEAREKLFIDLYKSTFTVVARYVSKMGGTFDEAKDIFQDALVIYYEKAVSNTLAFQSNEKAYLLGIAKHLWLRKFKDNSQHIALDGFDVENEEVAQPSD